MVKPFAAQAIWDKRQLIYIRFAEHEPFLEAQEGLQIYKLNPKEGFEEFTVRGERNHYPCGQGCFLCVRLFIRTAEAWATDLMMGNFFCVTCPYLFDLDTVAYFPLKRGMHSFDAVMRIRQTTQLLLELYQNGERFYMQPLKVWNRYFRNHVPAPHL